MVQVIAGERGKSRTKYLLDMANAAIKGAGGTVIYLDKNAQHMCELDNKIRLINASEFPLTNSGGFLGFIRSTISQDHNLEIMYLDGLLKLSYLEEADTSDTYVALKNIGERYYITFVLNTSMDTAELPECVRDDVITSLQ